MPKFLHFSIKIIIMKYSEKVEIFVWIYHNARQYQTVNWRQSPFDKHIHITWRNRSGDWQSQLSVRFYKTKSNPGSLDKDKEMLVSKMHKAIAIIQFKLEGLVFKRNPNFGLENRLLLDKIDYDNGTITIDGKVYPLKDTNFPTINKEHPYDLTEEEYELIIQLKLII